MQERAREELGEYQDQSENASQLVEEVPETPVNQPEVKSSKLKKLLPIDNGEKLILRLEFEFEVLEDEKKDVMDVEDIAKKDASIKKPFM
jgi:hypothetical protein